MARFNCVHLDFPWHLALKQFIQQWTHIVNAQVMATSLCDHNRYPRQLAKAHHIGGDALPVVFTHMDLAMFGRRKSASFRQFFEPGRFRRTERRACFLAFEITNNRGQQKHTPDKRLHLGLRVEEQVTTK